MLILFLPTIASTGFVRDLVLGKINEDIQGKISVESWSLGWFSGFEAEKIRIDDPSGNMVLSLGTLRTPTALTRLIGRPLRLENVELRDLVANLVVMEDGSTNLAMALAERESPREVPKRKLKKRRKKKLDASQMSGSFTLTDGRLSIRPAAVDEVFVLEH
ncbi:unnamed protein product, partial [marine sediment metagenome]